jgi:flagella basal body P-ring formation protein FlgA
MISLAAFALAAACFPIDAPQDRITAADLARALPEWAAIAPETPVLLAPVPNVVRVLHAAELRALAARFHVTSQPPDALCFHRPVAAVPADRMLAVMRARLPGAKIEILEPSRTPAPAGELDFPLTGLRPGYWFGYVSYGANHRFVVWARVAIKTPIQRIVASADLKAGEPIDSMQLRIETREEFPSTGSLADVGRNPDDFAGRVPRRTIKAGTVLRKEWLDAPKLVERGETVKVEVISGAARLEAQGIAEASGARGEMISVRNPESKRRFRARVESQGRVAVKGGV